MTYAKFKKELYVNILQRRETVGKQVRLLERECVCNDAESVRFVKTCNLILYGRSEVFVKEDMLCIIWGEWKIMRMLYWHTGGLYERFLREGWQGVLPKIISQLRFYGTQRKLCGQQSGRILDRLIIRPLNYPYNAEKLSNSI